MKLTHGLVLACSTGLLAFGGWLGCSSSDSTTPINTSDAGGDASQGGDSGGNPDTGGGGDSGVEGGNPDTGVTPDAGSDGSGGTPSCLAYCNSIKTNCTGTNAEYTTNDVCHTMCANLALGASGATSGDTVGCREYHAGLAASNPGVHCHHAGPMGGATCSTSDCSAFCALDIANCGTVAYADQATCETACAAYTYDPAAGDIAQTSGNTLNCRLYHLEASYVNAAAKATHCPHTGVASATCQ